MELTGGRGADVIITATAANVTQEQAIAMAARNGRISFFGGLPKTDPTITCDSNVVHYRQLHIHGANGSAPEHNKRALEYISTGQVPVKDLITEHIPLERALDAFRIVQNGEAIKVTVEPVGPDEVRTRRLRTGRLRRLGSDRASEGRASRLETPWTGTRPARPPGTHEGPHPVRDAGLLRPGEQGVSEEGHPVRPARTRSPCAQHGLLGRSEKGATDTMSARRGFEKFRSVPCRTVQKENGSPYAGTRGVSPGRGSSRDRR